MEVQKIQKRLRDSNQNLTIKCKIQLLFSNFKIQLFFQINKNIVQEEIKIHGVKKGGGFLSFSHVRTWTFKDNKTTIQSRKVIVLKGLLTKI